MASKEYVFTGEIKWSDLFVPDNYEGIENYKISILVEDDEYYRFKEAGIRTRPRKDEETGKWIVTFKRPAEGKKVTDRTGKEVILGGGAPRVVNKDGDGWNRDMPLIGRGSTASAKVVVYDAGRMGKGHRLEAVKIDNLIPYDDTKREQAQEPTVANSTATKSKVPF